MNPVLSNITLFVYLVTTLKYILFLIHRRPLMLKIAMGGAIVGFLFHTATLIIFSAEVRRFPFANFSESLSIFVWAIVLVHLVTEWRHNIPALGSFVMPLVLLGMTFASLLPSEGTPLLPVVRDFWFFIHVVFAFIGTAAFTLTFGVGIMYIIQERQLKSRRPGAFHYRLPSLEILDDLGYKALAWGFPFLTLGLVAGSVWARSAKGAFWSWDPQKTWPLVVAWLIYGFLLVGRVNGWWRGKKAAHWTILGFIVVFLSYWLHTS